MRNQSPYIVLFLLLGFIFTSSCDIYKAPDVDEFNEDIAGRISIKSPEDLVKYYYFGDEKYSKPGVTVNHEQKKQGLYQIYLYDLNLKDRLVKARRVSMLAHKIEDSWIVYEINESVKCSNSESDEWQTESCR